ncbi:unnamed protein product [Malus baccata var. baccata]
MICSESEYKSLHSPSFPAKEKTQPHSSSLPAEEKTQKHEPASEKHIRDVGVIVRSYVHACVLAVSKRLDHRLLNDGDPVFGDKISYATLISPEPIRFPIPSPYQISSS